MNVSQINQLIVDLRNKISTMEVRIAELKSRIRAIDRQLGYGDEYNRFSATMRALDEDNWNQAWIEYERVGNFRRIQVGPLLEEGKRLEKQIQIDEVKLGDYETQRANMTK